MAPIFYHRPSKPWDGPIPYPYSMGVKCGNFIFVGGQVAVDADGQVLHPDDIAQQTPIVMDKVVQILQHFGATMADVVVVNTFYVGRGTHEDWVVSAKIRATYFEEPGPVATGIPLPTLASPGLMLEVEAVAYKE